MKTKTKITHVIRGGSWDSSTGYVHSTNRYSLTTSYHNNNLSFRLIKLTKDKKYASEN